MDYQQTIDYLFSLQKFGIKLGLSSTENLLERLGRPQDGGQYVHLAGTNGKGSVGADIVSMLNRTGKRIGFYTSPHLVDFRERFVIGHEMISEAEVIELTERVRSVCNDDEPPTFFEFTTAMALLWFHEQQTDLAVMETGLGGRLDATNIIRPLVSVITNITLEHTDYLGPTLAHIAREKAGIIKPGVPVVVGEKRKTTRDLFERIATDQGAPLYAAGRDFKVRRRQDGRFDYWGLDRTFHRLEVGLAGPRFCPAAPGSCSTEPTTRPRLRFCAAPWTAWTTAG